MATDVFFEAERLPGEYKCCDGCFAIGKVTELQIPVTKYYNHKTLETVYNKYWFCDTCKIKLINALNGCDSDE